MSARLEPDEIKDPRPPNLRQLGVEQPQELPLGLKDAPLARYQADEAWKVLARCAKLLKGFDPTRLMARIEQERRGGISSPALDGRVSGTRAPKLPQLDSRDRTLERRPKDYLSAAVRAEQAFQLMCGIEAELLGSLDDRDNPPLPRPPTVKERRAASDLGVDCRRCSRPVACTPADRLIAGFCASCHRWWLRHGRPSNFGSVSDDESDTAAAGE